jgi:hypothetical protein
MTKNKLKFILILIFIMLFATGCSLSGTSKKAGEKITNFAECKAAGYPIMESYPARCAVPGGQTFTEVLTSDEQKNLEPPIVGGDKDEHGCIGSAGYSWCELKNKCLRIWEEPCLPDDEVSAVKDYLTKNISALSPQKEVLGGKFYITNTRFNKSGEVVVDYEDGHIALQGIVNYQFQNGSVKIEKFSATSSEPQAPGCNNYQPETCPAKCVVCPPCAACSSISCQTEDFCKSIGFDRSWYESMKNKSSSSPSSGGNDTVKGARACTMDAKQCPDGSYVSRTGPNCEFTPCPGE